MKEKGREDRKIEEGEEALTRKFLSEKIV